MALFSHKTVQLRAYADDIVGRAQRDVTAGFSVIERVSINVGLSVNESKMNYMTLSASRDMWQTGPRSQLITLIVFQQK